MTRPLENREVTALAYRKSDPSDMTISLAQLLFCEFELDTAQFRLKSEFLQLTFGESLLSLTSVSLRVCDFESIMGFLC